MKVIKQSDVSKIAILYCVQCTINRSMSSKNKDIIETAKEMQDVNIRRLWALTQTGGDNSDIARAVLS